MPRYLPYLFLLFPLSGLHAQVPGAKQPVDPVKWSISMLRVDSGSWDVLFRADIQNGWYLYSQQDFGEMGPIPTHFAFDTIPGVRMRDTPVEISDHLVQGHDPVFDIDVKKFKGTVVFSQRVEVANPTTPITGRLDYETCNDQSCIFPDPLYFKIVLDADHGEFGDLSFAAPTDMAPQEDGPVHWSITVNEKGEGLWRLAFSAHVEEGWYVYSQRSHGDEGPIPTSIRFDSLAQVEVVGEPLEEGAHVLEAFDEMFGMQVRKFKHDVAFLRDVRVDDPGASIGGVINYMSCNDESCIFPDPLRFSIVPATGSVTIGDRSTSDLAVRDGATYKLPKVDLNAPVVRADEGSSTQVEQDASLWRIFFLGFIGGLLALLTPCVFPMIPLTVSFFTKGSEDKAKGLRNAIMYGGFILVIYLLFSLPFHLLGSVNPEIFNEISTNPWLNIFFFVIFLVFAVSFFGYFEITLPASWVNRMDQNASRFGGWIGIFFMALTLALVSFSCTGPILGSLLAGALTAEGGAWQLTAGMGGFGLALALPFALFALFPQWLNSLPRSGSWLNSVKVVLGFAEVALAFKFLSNADLVKHWGLVRYELFMAIWVLCGLGIVLYLVGAIRFPHDSPVTNRSGTRWAFTGLFAAATVYLLMGFRVNSATNTFHTLKLMSGLAPPVGYSWVLPKHCPSDLDCYHDLEAAMAQARATGKPLLVDFTGYACVNCRKMEEHVWPERGVFELIRDRYVLVSLYVDDKEELPKDQQHIYVTSTGKQKEIVTKGNKWATVQAETFVTSSQPFYALLSPSGELLTDPVAYTPDPADYQAFLERGIKGMQMLGETASR
ncbi:MAG: thioredoxin family protein [Flavobacteriales bacterium]|nr:thioredoxin family protein [Flavobacteriales bacterium]MCB9167418.1 thioredoxin family protein [Flavobacteriales bacterium]